MHPSWKLVTSQQVADSDGFHCHFLYEHGMQVSPYGCKAQQGGMFSLALLVSAFA